MNPKRPTFEECQRNAPIELPDGRRGFAIVYPQVGGYSVCAIAIPSPTSSTPGGATDAPEDWCFDVLLFTDGEFSTDEPGFELHHCSASQFIEFGETMELLAKSLGAKGPPS